LEGELETILQLFTRATSAIEEIGRKHPGETVLISSHAALIKTLADEAEYREKKDSGPLPVYYEPKPTEPKAHVIPSNCTVYHFVYDESKLTFVGTENLLF
jgi:broad specificity phosphatase PhoE